MSELERDEGWLLVVVIIAAGLLVGVVAWAGARDQAGLDVVSARSAHPPMTWPEVQPVPTDEAWVGWRVDLFAGVAGVGVELTPEPEVEVSSITIERQPSGEIVVTNPPEAPVAPGELADLVCSFSWDCQTAKRVIACESSWNPQAVGRVGERGLAQVHPVHRERIAAMGYSWDDMFDPRVNLEVAWSIYVDAGHSWRPWTCAR